MAISGDYIWDVDKYTPDIPSTLPVSPNWKKRAAIRWAEMLGYNTPVGLTALEAMMPSDADCMKLLQPGYYPKIVSGAVTVMADGMFPNIINHNGEIRSPDGVLGLPERNEFGGESQSITDPAI